MLDLSYWLTKPEACARLGISERTLDRLVASRKAPERRLRQIHGRKPEPIFNPDDVERMAAELNPPRVMPPPVADALATTSDGRLTPGAEKLLAVLERMAAAIAERPAAPVAPEGQYLTIAQAAVYKGLSRSCLRRLVREGGLRAVKDRSIKVLQSDLDKLATQLPMARLAELQPMAARLGAV